MKIKKSDIIRAWDNSNFRKEYKRRLNYRNFQECYNNKREISGFILFIDTERFYFNVYLENKEVIIKKDIFENLAERQEFEQKKANNDLLLIY